MKKGIYLAAFIADYEIENLTYQDKYEKRDIGGDMLETDLTPYDYILATPPCNYYSRANYPAQREKSKYAQETKHLLPEILKKLKDDPRPWIVENVINKKLMAEFLDIAPYRYEIGRHTYWTNIEMNPAEIKQIQEPKLANQPKRKRQGGENVRLVLTHFINLIHKEK